MIKHETAFWEQTAGFDWDFLRFAFDPTRIEPMDIDGIVERKGHFLVFETKGEDKPFYVGTAKEREDGQSRMYANVLRSKPGWWTLFYVIGKTPKTIRKLTIYTVQGNGTINIFHKIPCGSAELAYWTYVWFQNVENGKKPISKEEWIKAYNNWR